MTTLRISCIAMILMLPAFNRGGSAKEPERDNAQGHRSGMTARLTSADGSSRMVKLEGVGCNESMCSRVFLRSTGEQGQPLRTWFDSVASIRTTTQNASQKDALLVMRDGTERRINFVAAFRVLYISGLRGPEKLDLASVRSLEFVDAGK